MTELRPPHTILTEPEAALRKVGEICPECGTICHSKCAADFIGKITEMAVARNSKSEPSNG